MEFLGEPNCQLSSKRELRRKGWLAVLTNGTKAGSWYDHEHGVGGDLIDLIDHGVTFPRGRHLRRTLHWFASHPRNIQRRPLARARLTTTSRAVEYVTARLNSFQQAHDLANATYEASTWRSAKVGSVRVPGGDRSRRAPSRKTS